MGNKAILPVLWELFPEHEYLLRAEFELSDALAAHPAGYVQKPIVGRCGQGVTMVDSAGDTIASQGNLKFSAKDSVYQQLQRLPTVAGAGSVLVCPWIIGGLASGVVLRADDGLITTVDRPIVCLRVDEEAAPIHLGRSCSEPILPAAQHGSFAPNIALQ